MVVPGCSCSPPIQRPCQTTPLFISFASTPATLPSAALSASLRSLCRCASPAPSKSVSATLRFDSAAFRLSASLRALSLFASLTPSRSQARSQGRSFGVFASRQELGLSDASLKSSFVTWHGRYRVGGSFLARLEDCSRTRKIQTWRFVPHTPGRLLEDSQDFGLRPGERPF